MLNCYELKFNKNQMFHFGVDEDILTKNEENKLLNNSKLNKTKFILSSDSLFSALCFGLNIINKKEGIDELIKDIKRLSSIFFGINLSENKKIYFVKKPIFLNFSNELFNNDRKITKKVEFVSLDIIKLYNKFGKTKLNSKEIFILDNKFMITKDEFNLLNNFYKLKLNIENSYKLDINLIDIIKEKKVKISHNEEDNKLFEVSSFKFNNKFDCFFWFLVDLDKNLDLFKLALKGLFNYGGLGGKITSGKGRIISYNLDENFDLDKFKYIGDNNTYFYLSSFFPKVEEVNFENLKNSKYNLIKKGGFDILRNQRRKTILMFEEGSCFNFKFSKRVEEVGIKSDLKIVKFSSPICFKIRNDNFEVKKDE